MKTQRAVLPLAFLSAAFMLACEDSRPTPVGPEGLAPLFHVSAKHPLGHGGGGAGDNPGSPFYKYTFSGDITTDPSPADAQTTVGTDPQGEVVLQMVGGDDNNSGVQEALILDSDFLVGLVGGDADALNCFGGIMPSPQFNGVLRPDKKVVNKVVAVLRFTAKDKSGAADVRYRLGLDGMVTTPEEKLDGMATGGIFPPEPGEMTTVTFTNASIGAARKKEKNACSGAGGFPGGSSVLLEGTNTDPDLP